MNIKNDSYCGYLNMDQRPDRLIHVLKEFDRVGISAVRHRGKLPSEFNLNDAKLQVMRNRTPGAIPCHYGQVEIMQTALNLNKHALICEDDIVFCDDIDERLEIINEFLSINNFDIFWFGGTYHKEPTWHKNPHPQDLKQCNCTLNRDWEPTNNPRIVRTYGAFSTHCYLVNKDSIEKVIALLDENVHISQGIDHNFIFLQPQLKAFAFVPGCVKQFDNQSNIGNGMTYFSGFSKLGDHWFKEKM